MSSKSKSKKNGSSKQTKIYPILSRDEPHSERIFWGDNTNIFPSPSPDSLSGLTPDSEKPARPDASSSSPSHNIKTFSRHDRTFPTAPIPIPGERLRGRFEESIPVTASLRAARDALDPKNRTDNTPHGRFMRMPGGDFIPPHLLAERGRGPPPLARSYPDKPRFKDNGDPPDWFF